MYAIIQCSTQLTRAYSGSRSSCRNLEQVILVGESTIYQFVRPPRIYMKLKTCWLTCTVRKKPPKQK